MVLTETERKVIGYLRNPLFRTVIMAREKYSPVDDLSNEELVSLYNKMDAVIEDEGNNRRGIGCLDEMYIVELSSVKSFLHKECIKRGLNHSPNKKLN